MKFSLVFLLLAAVLIADISAWVRNCQKKAKKAIEAGERPPTCNDKKFTPRQCDDAKCWCVKDFNGKKIYKSFEIPKSEAYDCSEKPTECIKERFDILLTGEETTPPQCNADGDYVEEECTKMPGSTNIALNQTAFQSETDGKGIASRGVDGNKEALWKGATCTGTVKQRESWWAVDLGEETEISKVVLYNRGDCCPKRLANFQIGVSNTNPEQEAPVVGNYDVCAEYAAAMTSAEIRAFECELKGRYVIVQLKGRNILTLCEVEVFGVEKVCE